MSLRPCLLAGTMALATACAPDLQAPRTLLVQAAEDGEYDDPSVLEKGVPFATIQDAVDAASSGDTIAIPSGTYTEDVEIWDSFILQGAGRGETIVVGTIQVVGGAGGSLSGVTMLSPTYVSSGTLYTTRYGVYVDGDGDDFSVWDVDAYYYAYGIYFMNTWDAVVGEVEVASNEYGIHSIGNYNFLLRNALVHGNSIAGILSKSSTGSIAHNTVVGNGYGAGSTSPSGGIALTSTDKSTVTNNIAVSNAAGIDCTGCRTGFATNLVWGNGTDYANDASAASGDVSADPDFAAVHDEDYHLTASSAAVDAGTTTAVTTDFEGEARPQGAAVDIGFDEHASSEIALVISEVLANAATESVGELVELYNAGSGSVDLVGLMLSDGDDLDTLQAFDGGPTTLAAGAYAVVVDPDYDGSYAMDPSVTLLTTGDSHLGNGLTTGDPVTLYESDGSTIIAGFSHPADPGDGVSMEVVDLETGDAAGNWRASACASGSSPGAAHCFPDSGDPADLVITEVMANAADERTGEYVEIYNPTDREIDLAGLVVDDGDAKDVLVAYDGGSTLVPARTHGVLIDPDFAGEYSLPAGVVMVTTADATLGNGIANGSDAITLYDVDGSTVIDSYTWVMDAGDGVSVEKIDYAAGDTVSNWQATDDTCAGGHSVGRLNGAAAGACEAVLITEVMANAGDEDTGEYVELYNDGGGTVELAGLCLGDGDATDLLAAYDGGPTTLAPGSRALIVDAEYAGQYGLDSGLVVVTTGDTTLGNSLSVSDEVTLYDADCTHILDAFLHPTNPGNGVSMERVSLDDAHDWAASTCGGGGSPGSSNCVSDEGSAISEHAGLLIITEIMSNPLTESTGEFVELYNAGSDPIDLAGFALTDGDATDGLQGYSDPADTTLGAGRHAVVLDADYAGEYSIPDGALLLTTDDAALGSGLSVNDTVHLYEANGHSLIDLYTHPFDAGNGVSVVKIDDAAGDAEDNWEASDCAAGASPGQGGCP